MPEEDQSQVRRSPQRSEPHPFAAKALKRFDRKRTDLNGILYATAEQGLRLSVSPAMFHRAIRVADALLKICESSGFGVALPSDRRGGFVATVDGQSLAVRLREQLHQVKIDDAYGPRTGYKPAGRLELLIDEWLDGVRKRWVDGKKRGQLENQLDRFVEGLRAAAIAKRNHEEQLERRRLEWEERRQREEQERARREHEQRMGRDLEDQMERWHRSRLIREYLAAAQNAALEKNVPVDSGSEFDVWLRWAHRYADRLDPLSLE